MAFSEEDLAYLRTRLGSTVNEDTNPAVVEDLEERYARLDSLPLVVVEVLRQRIADIADAANNPLNYTVVGEYSQDGSKNLDFLKQALADAEADAAVPSPGSVLIGVRPPRNRWGR